MSIFQLTRPSRGVTNDISLAATRSIISTHTPLTGRDQNANNVLLFLNDFNSHAPRGA